jgi:septal ring factor EnvC (AmiA/AmiB activator)
VTLARRSVAMGRFLSWVLVCVIVSAPAVAQDVAQSTRQLETLRDQIGKVQKQFEASRADKSRAERRLLEVERQISRVGQDLRRVNGELHANRKQLEELRAKRDEQVNQLAAQQQALAADARAAYVMGRQQQVKLLLNQEDPAAVGRALVYFGYLSRDRFGRIDSVRNRLRELGEVERSIGEKNTELSELRLRHEEHQRRSEEQKRERKKLLAVVTRQLQRKGNELKRLTQDEHRLQELVASLRKVLADIPKQARGQGPFTARKGKLDWPARGQLARRFGSKRGTTGLKWQGVLIAAPEGGEVRAISQGRVAFADWMRGFGLLLIIEHGDGYMSLYGHNEALHKEVGEWVDTGDVVATLGASGGQLQSGLYFELRHKGRPIDPLSWCAGKPAPAAG